VPRYGVILLHRYEQEVALCALIRGVFIGAKLLETKRRKIVFNSLCRIRHDNSLICLEA